MVRSFSNRILGGVCGGLANATPLNAWIWRIIFIALTLATLGAGAIVYLLLWWMLPLDSPIRRIYGGALRGLLAVLLSIGLIVGWFMRGRLFPADVYLPVAFLILGLVILVKQIAVGRHGNIAFGLAAVAVPTVFLLGALNILQGGLYDIALRSLPVVLVFLGLSILLRNRVPLSSAIALLVSGVLVIGVVTFAYSSRIDTLLDDNQITIDETVAPNITTLQVNVNTRDTDVRIEVSSTARTITGEFRGSNNSEVSVSYDDTSSPLATFTLHEDSANEFPLLENIGRSQLELQIPSDVAVAVAFEGDRGTMTFDLASVNLERLSLSVTEGDVVVTMPQYNPMSPSVRENPGTWSLFNGDLRVIVPDTVGTRFLLNRTSNAEPRPAQTYDDLIYRVELAGEDYVLVSRQYDALNVRVDYRINVYNGTLSIEQP
jgi:phage shock protein PspC (stress-responsive transcriptional regulator)